MMKYLLLLAIMFSSCQTLKDNGIIDKYDMERISFVSPICLSKEDGTGTPSHYYVAGAVHMACDINSMRPMFVDWQTKGYWDCPPGEYHWEIQVTCIDRDDYREWIK